MPPFSTLVIPPSVRYWIRGARLPACLLTEPAEPLPGTEDGTVIRDLLIADGRIGAIAAAGASLDDGPSLDLGGRLAWPTLVDMHTHLDKSHVIGRTGAQDGSFALAREAIAADRARHWTEEDIRARMEFALQCAYVHGVSAIRTHIDSYEGAAEASWRVFRALRRDWSDRVILQGVASVPIDTYATAYGDHLADLVARSGGVLGGVTRSSNEHRSRTLEGIDGLLDRLLALAAARSLDLDLHVDETDDPKARTLERVAAAVLRNHFAGRVVCGHCSSLAVQQPAVAKAAIRLCREAGLAIVALPSANMHLQDRAPGRTPRWRGVTLLHELRAAGIPVAVASDNCRDPFYPYGDHDALDTFRQAVGILHLDQAVAIAPALIARAPAQIMGVAPIGSIARGAPARLILFNARTLNQLICRPQADRIVIDRGRRVAEPLPDYAGE